jgi:hypothetical protein
MEEDIVHSDDRSAGIYTYIHAYMHHAHACMHACIHTYMHAQSRRGHRSSDDQRGAKV